MCDEQRNERETLKTKCSPDAAAEAARTVEPSRKSALDERTPEQANNALQRHCLSRGQLGATRADETCSWGPRGTSTKNEKKLIA
jgi:hypothetical protein